MTNYILIDLNNLIHRCKHVTQGDAATKSAMALHITLNAMRQAWRKFQGQHVVWCLDGYSWRRNFYPDYKAHRRVAQQLLTPRERADDELYFNTFRVFTEYLVNRTNTTVLQSEGVEADDFIARWIQLHPEDQHVIVSSDSDFYQLLAPNVRIYDGVKSWTISTQGVLDERDQPAMVNRSVKTRNDRTGKISSKPQKFPVETPDPQYELFFKIVRGDSSDNITSCYPGVRENGSSKKPGIREAFVDRHARGFDWNNFMLQEWNKPKGTDDLGNILYERVLVKQQYEINRQLIDLTQQPEEIKQLMDHVITETIQKNRVPQVGIWFLKFTEEMSLYTIGRNPNDYAVILNSSYAS